MITCLEKHFQHTPSSLAGYSKKEKKRKEYESKEKIIVNRGQRKDNR
jgi:hypothetical protein